ncbi:unnamed protein product [Porites evermanni]|uniref:Uncharacterized protein n=1 Tax=Porites evermanni TaxID=104178 RepID=A0ABN8M297_9CNID|nr:unnamed protein product [Porites evermanni]
MKARIFNLGIGDKDNGVNVGVDKDKGVDVGVTVGGKKIGIGAGKTGANVQVPLGGEEAVRKIYKGHPENMGINVSRSPYSSTGSNDPCGTPKYCQKLRLAGFLDRVGQDYMQRQAQEERGTKAGK